MTKGKILHIGLIVSFLGIITGEVLPNLDIKYFDARIFSSFILMLIVFTWVSSYVYRVINGKMTFMEQRKRYRKEYEKIINDKIEVKFNSLSKEEQERLMQDLEQKSQILNYLKNKIS